MIDICVGKVVRNITMKCKHSNYIELLISFRTIDLSNNSELVNSDLIWLIWVWSSDLFTIYNKEIYLMFTYRRSFNPYIQFFVWPTITFRKVLDQIIRFLCILHIVSSWILNTDWIFQSRFLCSFCLQFRGNKDGVFSCASTSVSRVEFL